MYTGTLIDDLFASVERAEDSTSRSLPQGTNPHTPQIVPVDARNGRWPRDMASKASENKE